LPSAAAPRRHASTTKKIKRINVSNSGQALLMNPSAAVEIVPTVTLMPLVTLIVGSGVGGTGVLALILFH
jgi:hypothetical protein